MLLDQFSRIAFSSEMGGDRRIGHLVRWVAPVRVWVPRDEIGERYLLSIHQLLQQLRQLTNHDIALASPMKGSGNLHIRFVSRAQVEAIAKRSAPCHTQVVTSNGQIVYGTITISAEDENQIRHCITEELTQSLGLLDDSDLITGSIFNDKTSHNKLILHDTLMLRTLYNWRLSPNMSKAQAMPIAKMLIGDFLR
ncbi:MAG: DUF2927 domain-containing protein [Rhodospirillales bacterium]|nr:DUF2927 domain-containing protein [Rhodospirillales bacterium]